jgi:CRP/FNR family transcriptional regulator, cyclic AMP receptor protein
MSLPYGLELTRSCENCRLRSEGFFCQFSKRVLQVFDSIKYITAYPGGAVLFVEEEPPRGVFVLCQGRVKLSMSSSEGKMVTLRTAKPGDVLGLHAVVSGEAYEATAVTLGPCQVNFVRREDFLQFLREHPEASIHAARELSSSYQSACEQIRSLALTHSASGKLAKFLLNSSGNEHEKQQGIRVRLTMTHEEIGQIIGMTRETVTRTLGEFKNKHFVVQNGSLLRIQNRAALEHFVAA